MLELIRIAAFVFGGYIVVNTLVSAVLTFVVPRSINTKLTSYVFRFSMTLFRFRLKKATTYEDRDRIMAFFAPATLFALPLVWVTLVIIGYMLMYWAIEPMPLFEVFKLSGSSLLTLGFAVNDNPLMLFLVFTEAAIGLTVVALLIAYLPTMYSAFSRRELAVSMLEYRAGEPPSSVTMITRYYLNDAAGLQSLGLTWEDWEQWFADVDESHTSLAPLVFFRSPQPGRSWITAAGTVLDTAAIVESTLEKPMDVRARLCIRAGFVALRHICDFFRIAYDPDPKPTDPISIQQSEFDEVYDALKAAGLPVVADREQAWRDYAGWRVNYDVPLLALAELTMAPYAQWISDRGLPRQRRSGVRLFNVATQWKKADESTEPTAKAS
jgi:hypothetical protein